MTELLCHTDSTLKEFDAEVTAIAAEESAVVLDRTAFFPGGVTGSCAPTPRSTSSAAWCGATTGPR